MKKEYEDAVKSSIDFEEDEETILYSVECDLEDIPYLIVTVDVLGINVRHPAVKEFQKVCDECASGKGSLMCYLSEVRSRLEESVHEYLCSTDSAALKEEIEHLICVLPNEARGWVESTFGDFAEYDLDEKFGLRVRPDTFC